MPTKIMLCSCEHEYQDKVYGKKRRVHNEMASSKNKSFRCSVCLKERGQEEIVDK